jgi:hypothetical protein
LPSNLSVLGSATLGRTTIAGGAYIDGTLKIDGNSLETVGDTLKLQPRGGSLDLADGAIQIDANGDVTVGKTDDKVKVEGALAVGTIVSGTDGNVTIDLAASLPSSPSSSTQEKQMLESRKLTIRGFGAGPAVSFDALGSALFSGSITAKKIAISEAEAGESRSVGQGVIYAGSETVSIANSLLTKNSLIYITPISRTGNKVLYVKSQRSKEECGSSECPSDFTVALDGGSASEDIKFNWWIIN